MKKEQTQIQKSNRKIIEELKKYLPEGCIQEEDHIPLSGNGCHYRDADGKEYIDFSSGILTNSLGHGYGRLNHAAYEQAMKLANIHGRHSEAELFFYKRLYRYLPSDDYRAVPPFNDGGYTIDRGLTDIINYYDKERIAIGAFRNGFHGKTQGTKLLINETEKAAFYDNFQIEFPNCYRCPWKRKKNSCREECVTHAIRMLKERNAKAIVFELIQGYGIIIPPEDYWKKIQDYCYENGIIMFADEVLTGGGRIGEYLAGSYYGITPDMIALCKGLANGRPMSLLLERKIITENKYAIRYMERSSTFAGYPETLAVAAELLKIIDECKIMENVKERGVQMSEGLSAIYRKHSFVGDARSIGLMGALEFVKNTDTKTPYTNMCERVFIQCRRNGLETIKGGNILRIAPALTISCGELEEGLNILDRSIAECE